MIHYLQQIIDGTFCLSQIIEHVDSIEDDVCKLLNRTL
jgi:hypothetical protein